MISRVLRAIPPVVVLAGGIALLSSPAAAFTDTCHSGDGGATCTGDTCCADATSCYTDSSICSAMYCEDHPQSPSCIHPT